MSEKNRLRDASKRCSYCGNRGRWQKLHRGPPKAPFKKKRDRLRHIWLCMRCRI